MTTLLFHFCLLALQKNIDTNEFGKTQIRYLLNILRQVFSTACSIHGRAILNIIHDVTRDLHLVKESAGGLHLFSLACAV